jgi:hypothetical protein
MRVGNERSYRKESGDSWISIEKHNIRIHRKTFSAHCANSHRQMLVVKRPGKTQLGELNVFLHIRKLVLLERALGREIAVDQYNQTESRGP